MRGDYFLKKDHPNQYLYLMYYTLFIESATKLLDCLKEANVVHDCDLEFNLEEAIVEAKLLKFKWYRTRCPFNKFKERRVIKKARKQAIKVDNLAIKIINEYLEQ